MPATSFPPRVWGALLTVYIIWGSTYLAIAIVVSEVPPLMSAGARFLAAGLLLGVGLGIRRGFRSLVVPGRQLAGAALIGTMLLFVGNGGVSLAERYVPSGISALLVSSVPLWVIVIRLVSGERPAGKTILGVLVGISGVAVLVSVMSSDDPHPGTGYVDVDGWLVALWMGVVLFGSFLWALGSFLSVRLTKAKLAPAEPMTAVFWQFMFAGCFLLIAGLASGESPAKLGEASVGIAAAWMLLVLGALVAYTCYIWLLHSAPISLVSTYAYVNPAVAVVLGILILHEPVSLMTAVAAALVLIGVILVVRGEARTPSHQPELEVASSEV